VVIRSQIWIPDHLS